MNIHHMRSPDPASIDAASPFNLHGEPSCGGAPGRWPREQRSQPAQAAGSMGSGRADPGPRADAESRPRNGAFEGHLPDLVDPLEPRDPDTSFEQTRRLRHDGWTPDKMRAFHERFAECGVLREACEAAGMSARSAYNLRDRDPLFAAGWDAAALKSRTRLADEAFSRSMNGVVERIYKDGEIVAERHKYDNRLTMAVLARLDARIDRAQERGDPTLGLVARWDDYLQALGEGRREDGLALLAAPASPLAPAADLQPRAGDRELLELHHEEEAGMSADDDDEDPHRVWEDRNGWWTDYPPPRDFDGDEYGSYGDDDYRRALSAEEQAVVDAQAAAEPAAQLAVAEAQRDAWFGFGASLPPEQPESPEPAESLEPAEPPASAEAPDPALRGPGPSLRCGAPGDGGGPRADGSRSPADGAAPAPAGWSGPRSAYSSPSTIGVSVT
jgi:hypothetical protein